MELIVNNNQINTTDEGFLVDLNDWNENIALEIAKLNDIELTPSHWEIVKFIRGYYQQYKHLPNTRLFIKAIKKQLGEEKGNSPYLHKLFPKGPLKFACKIAGIPKPPTCL